MIPLHPIYQAKLAAPHPSHFLDPNILKLSLIKENEKLKQHYYESKQRKLRIMCSSESIIKLMRKDNEEVKGDIQENGHEKVSLVFRTYCVFFFIFKQ